MTAIAPPPSRNDPCPCGSGKRYKHCHGSATAPVEMPEPPPANAGPVEAARAALRAGRAADAVAIIEASPVREDIDASRVLGEALRNIDAQRSRACWERVLAALPGDPEALFFLGDILREDGDYLAAIATFEQALAASPDHPALLNNLGLAREKLGDLAAAEDTFKRVLEVSPDDLNALANLAQNCYQQRRYKDAIPLFERLVRRMPGAPAAIWANFGSSMRGVGNFAAAEPLLARATELAPDRPEPWRDLGACRIALYRWGGAALAYGKALDLDPGDLVSASMLLHACGHECVWDRFDALRCSLLDAFASSGEGEVPLAMPFAFQSFNDDPAFERALAVRWSAHEFLPASPLRPARRSEPGKLRVGFLSPDFHSHPVGRLVVGLIERLDRTRFEVCAYSTNKEVDDAIRQRIWSACDRFRSFPAVDAREVAEAIRADRIDVLIDLTGHTAGANVSTLSLRPAPVQINYLGYTGTLGNPAVDWIVADAYCIPPGLAGSCVERPLYLEPCYLPRCGDQIVADDSISRSDYGLPEDALVYAVMSAAYKILPERFDAWMEILRAVPGSILWMRTMGGVAARRLHLRAESLGVDPARLLIARNEPVPRYIARYRLADLYLDTWPFGSHTTVNDALFAGLPVLTQAGRTFASRASASQVIAAGLPELVANGLQGYVDGAIALGSDRTRLGELSARLRANRSRLPYFDLDAYARAFEAAVERAWAGTPVD